MADPAVAPVDSPPGEYDFDDEGFGTPFEATPVKTESETPAEAAPESTAAEPAPEAPNPVAAGAAPVSSPAAPVLSPQQIQRAQAVGVSPESLQALGPNAELAIANAEKAALLAWTQAQQRQAQAPAQQTAQPEPLQPPAAPQLLDIEAVKNQYKAQGYEDNLIEVFARDAERHNQHLTRQYELDKKLFDLQQKDQERDKWNTDAYNAMQRMAQQQQQQQVAHLRELIDRDYAAFKASADPNLQKLLESPDAQQRIYQNANILMSGMYANGMQVSPNQDIFRQAAFMAFGGDIRSLAREEVRGEVKAAQGRAIARPSSGAKPQRTGSPEDRAFSHAEEWYRRQGIGTLQPIHSAQDL